MARLYLVLTIITIAFTVFSFVSVVLTESWRVKALPKIVWLFIVIILSPIGGILWFAIGREKVDGEFEPPARKRPVHPDDDPEFLARVRQQKETDERIARLEKELADLDTERPENDGQPDTK
jgi:uncharacterized membrane protein